MKPIKLTIKGLNSFIEEQVIDFKRLTDKGLFGIFGPTGSGKSTILDAMTIALYGNIAREAKEFINTNCDSLSVSYEFEILYSGERKTYCAERVISKDKTGNYKSKHVTLLEYKDGGKIVIAEGSREVKESIENILGLTAEDFTRSVVLPQGKFSEFLKLTGKDRRNMLERLFGLERFGRHLGNRIRDKRKAINDSLNLVLGRARTYEEQGISEDKYKELKEHFLIINKRSEDIKREKDELDKQYEINKNLWALQQELAEYKNKYQEQIRLEPEIEARRSRLKAAQNAWKVKPFLEAVKDTEEKLAACKQEIEKLNKKLHLSSDQLLQKEAQYKNILEQKEKELPRLIQKETNLSAALERVNKLKDIQTERERLLKQYKEKKALLEEANKKEVAVANQLSKLQEDRQALEKRLDELVVDPAYREDINKLAVLQDEGVKLRATIQDLKERQLKRKDQIGKLEVELKEVQRIKEQKFGEIAITEERLAKIMELPPPDNSVLFEQKEAIYKLEKLIEELKSFQERKDQMTGELEEIDKELHKLNSNHQALTRELKELLEKLELVEKDIDEAQKSHIAYKLAEELMEGEPCPVCGSTHHPAPALQDSTMLAEKMEIKEVLVKEQRELEDKIRKTEVDKELLQKNREYIGAYLEPLEAQYKGLELEKVLEEKAKLEKEFQAMTNSIEQWNKEKETLEKSLSLEKENKTTIEQKELILAEQLKAERAAYDETSIDLENNEKKLAPVLEELESLKKLYNIEDIALEQKQLKEKEKEGRELQQKLKAINEEIDTLNKQKEDISKSKSILEVEIAKITESGKEKKAVIDRETEYINVLSEGKEVSSYLEEVRLQKTRLQEQEGKLKEQLESCKEENRSLNDSVIKATTTSNSLMQQLDQQKERLLQQLKVNEFNSCEEAERSLLSEDLMKTEEEQINAFDNNKNNLMANINRIKDKIGANRIDEKQWQQLIDRRAEVHDAFENNIKERAEAAHKIKEMEVNLAEYKELLKQKKELEHISSHVEDIAKLIEGNKFVEFVALNQLKYICIEASKRLKDITSGRYALEIDSAGNFVMRDDFNGGSRRATGTLSGGETFLTSLCLALALSSQIQLKGSAPLEFFFLDEGFGTLDNDLLDTVMDSLERLYSDRLSVGIISHVEEIKNRVPIRLLVEPAQHGIRGSRVKIELN